MKLETELRYVGFDINAVFVQASSLAQPTVIKFRRAVFDLPSQEGWLRLRTDGLTTTLTVKITSSERPAEALESELIVEGFDEALAVLEPLGYIPRSMQTNYRVLFKINGCEFTIDLWPQIAPIVEIEGDNETEILKVSALFPDLKRFRTDSTVSELYEVAGIDVRHAKNLEFDTIPVLIESLVPRPL